MRFFDLYNMVYPDAPRKNDSHKSYVIAMILIAKLLICGVLAACFDFLSPVYSVLIPFAAMIVVYLLYRFDRYSAKRKKDRYR